MWQAFEKVVCMPFRYPFQLPAALVALICALIIIFSAMYIICLNWRSQTVTSGICQYDSSICQHKYKIQVKTYLHCNIQCSIFGILKMVVLHISMQEEIL